MVSWPAGSFVSLVIRKNDLYFSHLLISTLSILYLFLYKLFNNLLSIHIFSVLLIIFKNKSIYFLNTNKTTNYRIKTFFSKEPETLQWINSFNNGDVFWDIGANVGLYSIYSQFVNKKIETIAFEPSVLNCKTRS